MKKIIVVTLLISFSFAYPLRSFASVEQASIVNFGKLSVPEACFVAIQINQIIGNQFNGTETLFFNGNPVANLAVLLTLGVVLSIGSVILFGSPAFQSEAGADPDIMISDQDCANLQEGDEISFSGSAGSTLVALTIVGIFITSVAFLLAQVGGNFDRVDLLQFSVILTALIVGQIIVGTGPLFNPGGGGGGGCALAPKGPPAPMALSFIIAFLSLGVLGMAWRRRLED